MFPPLLFLSTSFFIAGCCSYNVDKYEVFMPNVRPKMADSYLCTPVRIEGDKSYYIVGFEPKATMQIAHHIILYGCAKPGSSSKSVWSCGEMTRTDEVEFDDDQMEVAPPCDGQSFSILYAWARDAPDLHLPKDVGFKVGADTEIQYLVLQVHYAHVEPFQNGHTDSSGIYLHHTTYPLKKLAGILLLGTGGQIPPMSVESLESACMINERKVLHPFAFRTHTHSLGVLVSGYRVRRIDGVDQWTLIGQRDPLTPQMFYPIKKNITLHLGDMVAASCKMSSHRRRITKIGTTGNDEMCNFYLMYWVEANAPLKMKTCFTSGPPFYRWRKELNNIPLAEQIMYP